VLATCSSSGPPITLTIADGNVMAGSLLSDQFKRHSDFTVVSCAVDSASLLSSVRQIKSAVALISADLRDGVLSGLAALRAVHEADPDIRSILLFDRSEPHLVVEGLRAGARGVFSRSTFDFAALRKCVRRVWEGQIWINNTELAYVIDALTQARPLRVIDPNGLNLLRRREEQVMRLVAEGLGNREIAEQMNLSEHTVKNYLFHIFDKLGISNRVELVLYAVTNPKGLTPMPSRQEKPLANAADQEA
jgi:DNA-binding NarL/FixJ family response regulator